jgi:hypothetical protein
MNNSQNPVARREGLVIQEMPEEVLVYDTNTNKAHCLNQTAAFIWKACDGSNSVRDISKLVADEFGGAVSDDFVWLAIDQFNKDNLLQEKVESKFEGVSRREVIRKIGLAAVVALPVVASLAVPNTVLAVGTCVRVQCCAPSTTGGPTCPAGSPPSTCPSPCVCPPTGNVTLCT